MGAPSLSPRLLPRPNCFSSSAFARTESSGLRGAEGDKCVKERTKSPIPSQSGRGAFLGRLEGRSWPGGAAADSGTPPLAPSLPCTPPRTPCSLPDRVAAARAAGRAPVASSSPFPLRAAWLAQSPSRCEDCRSRWFAVTLQHFQYPKFLLW